MSKYLSSPAAVCILSLVASLGALPAQAASAVTFVSSKGTNSGNCSSAATPCLTFQYALNQTLAGGEINALDAGNYGPVIINKAISIAGVEGAGIIRGSAGDAVTVNAGANDLVVITGLALDGFKQTADHGVRVNSGGFVTIKNCAIRNFSGRGIAIFPKTGTSRFLIEDTVLVHDGQSGILAVNDFGGIPEGVARRVSSTWSQNGITIGAGAKVTIAESLFANNTSAGILVSNGTMRLSHSVVTENGTGISKGGSPVTESAGDNLIRGNAIESAPPSNVGTQ